MSTQKAKFELYSRLQALGFTYEEAVALRRIEMTLQRWAEAECNGEIQRDDETNKPFRHFQHLPDRTGYLIADREAGALRRLKAIVDARNARYSAAGAIGEAVLGNGIMEPLVTGGEIIPYHQTDPRGCALYLLKRSDLGGSPINQVYSRGVAVCA